jgi:hypothetical protein
MGRPSQAPSLAPGSSQRFPARYADHDAREDAADADETADGAERQADERQAKRPARYIEQPIARIAGAQHTVRRQQRADRPHPPGIRLEAAAGRHDPSELILPATGRAYWRARRLRRVWRRSVPYSSSRFPFMAYLDDWPVYWCAETYPPHATNGRVSGTSAGSRATNGSRGRDDKPTDCSRRRNLRCNRGRPRPSRRRNRSHRCRDRIALRCRGPSRSACPRRSSHRPH